MRYRDSGPEWNFIGCCELIATTTPAPTTTTSFISYYEGDGNCTEEIQERYSRDKTDSWIVLTSEALKAPRSLLLRNRKASAVKFDST